MTRPSGTTPRGLPYPGSANIHANTPQALQALAEAVTAQLGSIGDNVIFDTFVGKIQTGGVLGYQSSVFRIAFPKLSQVIGCVASYGNFAGGALVPAFLQPSYSGVAAGSSLPPNQREFFLIPVSNSTPPYTPGVTGQAFSVCALAWGNPA